jgi:DNA mismatch endonuclease (patch repair protein)
MDNVSKDVRSRTMRAVRGRNTAPELALRRALWAAGLRGYRIAPKAVPGAPDVAYPGLKFAVFIDGCFWHGCPQHCRRPSSNTEYWHKKLDRNIERDQRTTAGLEAGGWVVLRLWEHEVTGSVDAAVTKILNLVSELRAGQRPRLPATEWVHV